MADKYGTGKKGNPAPSPKQNFNEEISAEQLAKDALAETIRDGGAFASENRDQFKQ